MRIRLHKPRQQVWTAALVLFIIGVIAPYLPVLGAFAFALVALSAALLLLGTWLF